ncbi:MAG: shikimate dehydrogenase [Xanthomonadales bacterium]|nr:shikimate dehydrogenase [Gammaproteobacteria bacterium]MBT8052856.1 shikimate dehydrogenase [Gammaproteobacteria bacterium]NND55683.1 shikimate dehydrogenase [Xanthomonadales bacterium]NNK49994.1 shikimate dehydrogenase [Xanthomonadales bacterium]
MKLAVFGNPVAHSLSPRIHRLFAGQCGLDVDYRAIEANRESFPALVARLAAGGGRGCNITVPLKHEAWKLAARSSECATRARAANTLVFNDAEDWYADSTDGNGLVNHLETLPGCALAGSRLCLIGAGGAAASVLGALLEAGPDIVFIANRTRDRAAEVVDAHSGLGVMRIGTNQDLASCEPFDLIINATSLGHDGDAPALEPAWLKPDGLCYDMNYGGAADPLRRLCQEKGIRYSDGLGMLVGQAALSFTLWTGMTPDAQAVLEILRRDQP